MKSFPSKPSRRPEMLKGWGAVFSCPGRGLHAIAISHPHFIGTARLWQKAFTTDGKAPPPVRATHPTDSRLLSSRVI